MRTQMQIVSNIDLHILLILATFCISFKISAPLLKLITINYTENKPSPLQSSRPRVKVVLSSTSPQCKLKKASQKSSSAYWGSADHSPRAKSGPLPVLESTPEIQVCPFLCELLINCLCTNIQSSGIRTTSTACLNYLKNIWVL